LGRGARFAAFGLEDRTLFAAFATALGAGAFLVFEGLRLPTLGGAAGVGRREDLELGFFLGHGRFARGRGGRGSFDRRWRGGGR
jgi:hypothetical protein